MCVISDIRLAHARSHVIFSACAIMSTTAAVPLVHLNSSSPSDQFHELVYPARRPAVLRGAPLGRAPSLWTPGYLAEKCGERPVRVHVSPVPQMDFIRKNFVYRRVTEHIQSMVN